VQCYFAATLMIAIFNFGIINLDVTMIFLLLPLTMNGVAPVVLAYVMLVYHGLSSSDVSILSFVVYAGSSSAFWIIYAHFRSFILNFSVTYNVVVQFTYGLSDIDACGGLSALTVCPDNLLMGRESAVNAVKQLQFIPLLVWGIATAILLGTMAAEVLARVKHRRLQSAVLPQPAQQENLAAESTKPRTALVKSISFWLTTVALVGCVGLQMSLLYISLSLDMFDPTDWGFGQIIAVTIWAPPIIDYTYTLLSK
jgi:hypothetical protein